MEANVVRIIFIVILSVLWSGVIIYYFGFNKNEKKYFINSINKIIVRLFKNK